MMFMLKYDIRIRVKYKGGNRVGLDADWVKNLSTKTNLCIKQVKNSHMNLTSLLNR